MAGWAAQRVFCCCSEVERDGKRGEMWGIHCKPDIKHCYRDKWRYEGKFWLEKRGNNPV